MINLKEFGAVGDGVTDDTDAIQAALNEADLTDGKVFAPAAVYMHTGFTIPRDTTLQGESRVGTIFRMMDYVHPEFNVKIGGPRAYLDNVRIDGYKWRNDTGDGVYFEDSGTYFSGISNTDIKNCNGVGLTMKQCHSGFAKNVSIDRCTVSAFLERNVGLRLDTLDLARFTECGLWLMGSKGIQVVSASNLYQETWIEIPQVDAPFIRIDEARHRDMINIDSVYMHGHYLTDDIVTVGIELRNPHYIDDVKIHNVCFNGVKTPVKCVGVTKDTIGHVEVLHTAQYRGTDPIKRHIGVITDDSYTFEVLSDNLNLELDSSEYVYPLEHGGPMEITGLAELVTRYHYSLGNASVSVGTDFDKEVFGVISAENNRAKLTVKDKLPELVNTKIEGNYNSLVLSVKDKLEYSGHSKYKIRGIVF